MPVPLPHQDPDVRDLVESALAGEPAVAGFSLAPGSAEGTDLAITLRLAVADWRPAASRAAESLASRLAGRMRRGVEIRVDQGGAEARRFGVATSGHVCLFSAEGELKFSGGITPSRGHEGDNRGIAALKALLVGGQADATNRVYGCPLFSTCERPKFE